MRIILNDSRDPYFNLAAEEYLLENSVSDIFMLWQNDRSVIIGKNQNVWSEVNTDYTEANGIAVVRRLTGGGAVFHDPGNVNFTFITDAKGDEGIDFKRFILPVISAIDTLGIKADADGRNDIVSDGYKISGNAQCRYRCKDGRERIMHHGTLLYDADLGALAGALHVNEEKLRSKGIKSVSSRVKNLRNIGGLSMTADEFTRYLLAYAEREYGCTAEMLSGEEKDGIVIMAETKYSTWEWNFGKSPECENVREKRFLWGSITIGYTLKRGVFSDVSVNGDFFGTEDVGELGDALLGVRFDRASVSGTLEMVPIGKMISGATADDIITLLFE